MFVVPKHIQRNLKNFIDNRAISAMSSKSERVADLPYWMCLGTLRQDSSHTFNT